MGKIAVEVEKIILRHNEGATCSDRPCKTCAKQEALAIEKYILDRKPNLFNSIGSGELHIKEIALNEWQCNLEEKKSEV